MNIVDTILFILGFYCSQVLFSCLGVYAIDRLKLCHGMLRFALSLALKKLVWFSALILILPVALYLFTHSLRLTGITYLVILVVGIKLLYRRITIPAWLVLVAANIIAVGVMGSLIKFRLAAYIYAATVVGMLAIMLLRALYVRWANRLQRKYEARRKGEFLKTIKENPDFQTFCYNCKFYIDHQQECFRRLNRLPIKNMYLKGNRSYCLYWIRDNRFGEKTDVV